MPVSAAMGAEVWILSVLRVRIDDASLPVVEKDEGGRAVAMIVQRPQKTRRLKLSLKVGSSIIRDGFVVL